MLERKGLFGSNQSLAVGGGVRYTTTAPEPLLKISMSTGATGITLRVGNTPMTLYFYLFPPEM